MVRSGVSSPRLRIVAVLLAAATLQGADLAAQDPTPEILVQRLGSIDFQEREAAQTTLMKMGPQAEAALAAGCDLPDREIRYRARRILSIVKERDFLTRLQAFENGADGAGDELPLWPLFRDSYGDTPAYRKLFAEMCRDERELLVVAQQGAAALEPVFDRRLAEVVFGMNMGQQLSLGTTTAFLLVCRTPGFSPKSNHISHMNTFWQQPAFTAAMDNPSIRDALKPLTGDFIVRMRGNEAYMGLSWAMQYNLPRGAELARKTLEKPPQQVHVTQHAMLALGRLGDKTDLPLLETYFTDATNVNNSDENGRQRETQVRDIALAITIHIEGSDLKAFGFVNPMKHLQYGWNTQSFGFLDPKERDAVFAAWKTYRETGQAPGRPKADANAKTGDDETAKVAP